MPSPVRVQAKIAVHGTPHSPAHFFGPKWVIFDPFLVQMTSLRVAFGFWSTLKLIPICARTAHFRADRTNKKQSSGGSGVSSRMRPEWPVVCKMTPEKQTAKGGLCRKHPLKTPH